MLRISVITLIRTDTTLDLSQKAEKGKSLLCRPESRFSGPQAMTLSRHFYDPGEGAAKRRQLARAWAPQGPRAPFSGPAYRRGAAPAAFLLVRGSLAAAGVGRKQGLPQRALVCAAPRAGLPLRAWLLPLGRELAFCFAVRCVYVAKSSRRAAAARQQPKGLSAPDSPTPPPRPSERREDSTARPRYDQRRKKSSRRQPRRTRHDPPRPLKSPGARRRCQDATHDGL